QSCRQCPEDLNEARMNTSKSFALGRVPLFTLVAGVGLTVVFLVPVAYELTEKPWNRTRLVGLERAAMVSVAVACGLGVLEFWYLKRVGTGRGVAPLEGRVMPCELF